MSNQQTTDGRGVDWTHELAEQLEWHWSQQLRPRLEGLTDAEYFAEPVPGWSLRPRGQATTSIQGGSGSHQIEFEPGAPDPAPFTSIAWRLGHVIVGVLALRNAGHFGREETDYLSFEYAPTAAGALTQLDTEYDHWITGVHALTEADLAQPCGPTEGPFGELPMATLVLHIHRELIHHGAEISLLRDLYAHQGLNG